MQRRLQFGKCKGILGSVLLLTVWLMLNARGDAARGARPGNVINVVTDCRAVGDGCTDDAATINTCLADNPGRTFFFPQRSNVWSDYFLGGTLVVPPDVVLVGEGQHANATNITFAPACSSPSSTPSDSDLPTFPGVDVSNRVTIRNMRFSGAIWCSVQRGQFSGTAPHVPTGHAFNGLEIEGWTNLSDVYVCGFGQDGIEVVGDNVVFANVQSWFNYGHGFHFPPYATSPDAHVNVCVSCISYYNQVSGVTDESKGNSFVSLTTEGNYVDSVVTDDGTNTTLISPWFEGTANPPRLGQETIVIGPLSGTHPDWSREPVWMDAAQNNGNGGVLVTPRILAQEPLWSQGASGTRTDALSSQVFGTGSPSGFPVHAQTAWYTRDNDDLGTVAFGETIDPEFGSSSDDGGWWCLRSAGMEYSNDYFQQRGHPTSSLCIADTTVPAPPQYTPYDGANWMTRAWLPHGVFLGDGLNQDRINISVAGSPRSGACTPGTDGIAFADSFTAGGYIGWVCTSGGVWRGFGAIQP